MFKRSTHTIIMILISMIAIKMPTVVNASNCKKVRINKIYGGCFNNDDSETYSRDYTFTSSGGTYHIVYYDVSKRKINPKHEYLTYCTYTKISKNKTITWHCGIDPACTETGFKKYGIITFGYLKKGVKIELHFREWDLIKYRKKYKFKIVKTTIGSINKTGVIKNVKSLKKHQVSVKWKKEKNIVGYEIWFSREKSIDSYQERFCYGRNYTHDTLKDVPSGVWYVRMRPYKRSSEIMIPGKWSKVKKVKVK